MELWTPVPSLRTDPLRPEAYPRAPQTIPDTSGRGGAESGATGEAEPAWGNLNYKAILDARRISQHRSAKWSPQGPKRQRVGVPSCGGGLPLCVADFELRVDCPSYEG